MFNNVGDIQLKTLIDDDTDFIPLLTSVDEEHFEAEKMPETLPILPLRNMVLFPGVVIPITVGRDKSIQLIREANSGNKIVGVLAQINDQVEDPKPEDLHTIGTVANIVRVLKMPDGNTTVIIQGKKRFRTKNYIETTPYLKAEVEPFQDVKPSKTDKEFDAIISNIKEVSLQIIRKSPNIPSDAAFAINNIEGPNFLVNFVSSNMNSTTAEKQLMLEVVDLKTRALKLLEHLNKELQMLELRNQIQHKTKQDIDKQQREYYLNQQMKAIQEELGENNFEQEINELKERSESKKWSKEVKAAFEKNISKLQRMNPNAAEYGIQVNYLELLLDLPWDETTKDNFDLNHAQKILDEDHYGLEKVKERIIEHLAVLKLKQDLKSPIICLYGPPGVGKTSLGKSIAKALNRNYVRMSLGGLKDESEIRGHRKTYIGAMPGRILQNLKKVQSSNPVFVLDEIDKVGNDFHGDPSSALLEVLDPEQNTSFYDNFLEMDYDLSKVMFIATCNNLSSIQPALRDRMEIIEVNGYTVEEKIEIAKRHLLPKQVKENGLKPAQLKLSDKIIETIIENYTAESGVRSLEKKISKLARHIAVNVAKEKAIPKISENNLVQILGPAHSKDKYQGNDNFGVVTGLAWTQVGGDILYIESSINQTKSPRLTLTGNLGEVMKESATIALEYLKANPEMIEVDSQLFENLAIHIHVPEGATPKDGPSAGIAMLTSIASSITKRKIKKALAMTGEITLRGKVLPVGGIKEKILAAKRAGIKEVLLSSKNKVDVEDINQKYLKGLKFIYVDEMKEVLDYALIGKSNTKKA
ncbi:MAG: endopeptidase La [Bacteroidia bacterium]